MGASIIRLDQLCVTRRCSGLLCSTSAMAELLLGTVSSRNKMRRWLPTIRRANPSQTMVNIPPMVAYPTLGRRKRPKITMTNAKTAEIYDLKRSREAAVFNAIPPHADHSLCGPGRGYDTYESLVLSLPSP